MRLTRLLCSPMGILLLSQITLTFGLLVQGQNHIISGQLPPSPLNSAAVDQHQSHHHESESATVTANSKRSIFGDKPIEVREPSCSSVAAGFLLNDATDLKLNKSDPIDEKLSQILDRDGPDTRPSRDYHDFKDITLDISKRAWRLLHDHVSVAVHDQVELAWPAIERLLSDAKTSSNCTSSIKTWLDGAKRMDSWAIRMLNSWGHFPMSGIYEGTYGSVGAFHTCLDIEENKPIGHAHYCSVTFRPVMPSQKDYELIVRQETKELRQMFEKGRFDAEEHDERTPVDGNATVSPPLVLNSTTIKRGRLDYKRSSTDAFTDLLEHAQYHHFLYYKWGTCWPIQCSPFDVRRLAKLFGRRSILLNGPVKCYSKFEDDYEQLNDEMLPNDEALVHLNNRKVH